MRRTRNALSSLSAVGLVAFVAAVIGGATRGPIDSMGSRELRSYLRTLHFVPDPEAGARQPLPVGHFPDSARYGPIVTVQPEVTANDGGIEELKRGKIIARLRMDSGPTQAYPELGLLPNTTTYWWVEYDSAKNQGRSVFITVDADSNIVQRTVSGLDVRKKHEMFRTVQPLTRFVWENNHEKLWGTCNGLCCSKNGPPPPSKQ